MSLISYKLLFCSLFLVPMFDLHGCSVRQRSRYGGNCRAGWDGSIGRIEHVTGPLNGDVISLTICEGTTGTKKKKNREDCASVRTLTILPFEKRDSRWS